MRRFINFIKTTALGGLLVIVPIAIILFVLGQLFLGLYGLSRELMALLQLDVDDAMIVFGIAALALVALCFFTGLIVRTRLGNAIKRWFNRHIARRIPMYNAIASLTRRFAGVDGMKFAPVEVDLYGSETRALGFLIETLPDNRCTVFVPTAPVATVGNIYVVSRDRAKRIDASMADALAVVTQWGVDSRQLFVGGDKAEPVDDSGSA